MFTGVRGPIAIGATVLAGGLSLATPGEARASGFDVPHVGNGASSPLTPDAAAVHWNPGQLGYLERGSFDFGAGVIFGRIGYTRERRGSYQFADNLDFSEPIDPNDLDPAKTGTDSQVVATPLGPSVDLFVAAPVIADRLTLGGGFYIPYAAILDLPRDGAQRFALQSITLASAHTTFSAAVRINDVISIGAGVSYVFSLLELSKVQDFGAVDLLGEALAGDPINQANDFGSSAPSTVRELDVMARPIEISGAISHSASFNAGIALRPTDDLDLALVYQHGSRLRFRGDFQLDMDDDFFTQDLAAQGLEYPSLVRGTAEIELRLPKRVTVGAGYQVSPRFRLDGWVTYATYQDFDVIDITLSSPDLAQPELGIPDRAPQPLVRDWRGSVMVEVTPRIAATDRLQVNTLLGYHSPASPDSTLDLASPDGHRIVFGAGVGYAITPNFNLLVDFEGQAILPRSVSNSDFDLGNGDYSLFVGQLGLHGQLKFGRKPTRSPPEPPEDEPPSASQTESEPPADPPRPAESEPPPAPASEPVRTVPPPPPPPPPG